MRVIGRLNQKEMYEEGDLLIAISSEEWDLLRTLVGTDNSGDVHVDMKIATAFRTFRVATERAARALGLVPPE